MFGRQKLAQGFTQALGNLIHLGRVHSSTVNTESYLPVICGLENKFAVLFAPVGALCVTICYKRTVLV